MVRSPAENAATVRDAHDTLIQAGWSPDDVAEWLDALAALLAQAEAGASGPCRCDKCRDCVAANGYEQAQADRDAAVRERDQAREALRQSESAAIKAAQLLPMTVSTSVEADHRDDHASWAGWLLRHKVLPVIRAALTGEGTG